MGSRKKLYEMMYKKAKDETRLGWYGTDIPLLVEREATQPLKGGNAVDLGCGTGLNAVYLAKKGYQVIGVDFVSSALNFARKNAMEAKVNVEFVLADILEWQAPYKFDLILDSGCLHGLSGENREKYKAQLLKWLKPSSVYVLIHFAKRRFYDLNIFGPQKRTREDVERFFKPDLRIVDFLAETGKEPLNQYLFVPSGA